VSILRTTTAFISLALFSLMATGQSFAAAASNKQLQAEIEQLKKQNSEITERLDAVTSVLEQNTNTGSDHAASGHASANSSSTYIGGYGELHYNNLQNQNPGGTDKKELDFHRFVLFFGHDFTDSIRFFSELELEHAFSADTADGSNDGEVELEQAYLEFDLSDSQSVKTGVFLIPVGIINETHEPNTFYGVERNSVEKNIIPSTWWEAGALYNQYFDNALAFDVAVHSGLNTSSASNYSIRSGRQKASKAKADDLAYTARLKWTGINGLELAATLQHQADVTQGLDATAGSATLIEAHLVWQTGPFALRALYANWDLDGSGPASVGADKQRGWYAEPSYRINPQWGIFARYSEWDNRVSDATDSETTQIDVGFNYWPHENVVLKFDYQDQDTPVGTNEFDGFNLGMGYQF